MEEELRKLLGQMGNELAGLIDLGHKHYDGVEILAFVEELQSRLVVHCYNRPEEYPCYCGQHETQHT